MKEIIKKIEEINWTPNKWDNFCGYLIQTNKQDIKILIENKQSCYEDWGYISTPEDLSEYIGAELLNVDLVDDNRTVETLEEDINVNDCIFVNVNTSKGTIDFAVYNHHNGYYGHDVKVIVGDEIIEDTTL